MTMAKILLVDDDPYMMDILTAILTSEGYEIEPAGDGEEALQKIADVKPDVIVTDVMLPKLDGWKLCKKVKENPETKMIPILIMTAKGEQMSELMSYESGADAYISKPFQNKDLVNSIKQLLGS